MKDYQAEYTKMIQLSETRADIVFILNSIMKADPSIDLKYLNYTNDDGEEDYTVYTSFNDQEDSYDTFMSNLSGTEFYGKESKS